MRQVIALFGEAEKGDLASPLRATSLTHLNERLGQPPLESQGLFFAVQFLMYEQEVLYIRVEEEGLSRRDYLKGLKCLASKEEIDRLTAVCLPGVGDAQIIESVQPVTEAHRALMIMTERDLYDYLTSL